MRFGAGLILTRTCFQIDFGANHSDSPGNDDDNR